MNRILRQAMSDCDNYVIEMDYDDAKGNRTHRIVSPIRFIGQLPIPGALPVSGTTSPISTRPLQKPAIDPRLQCDHARPDGEFELKVGRFGEPR